METEQMLNNVSRTINKIYNELIRGNVDNKYKLLDIRDKLIDNIIDLESKIRQVYILNEDKQHIAQYNTYLPHTINTIHGYTEQNNMNEQLYQYPQMMSYNTSQNIMSPIPAPIPAPISASIPAPIDSSIMQYNNMQQQYKNATYNTNYNNNYTNKSNNFLNNSNNSTIISENSAKEDSYLQRAKTTLNSSNTPDPETMSFTNVRIKDNIYLKAIIINNKSEIVYSGLLYYLKNYNLFAMKIAGNILYGNIGKIYHRNDLKKQNVAKVINCKDGSKCIRKNNCKYYHSGDIRNYISENMSYLQSYKSYSNMYKKSIGDITNLEIDIEFYKQNPDNIEIIENMLFNDLLCLLTIYNKSSSDL